MPYKQNCKVEGEVITKLKIAKLYFSGQRTQKEIAENIQCHYNTINNIIKKCKLLGSKYDTEVYDTEGVQWKQTLVERYRRFLQAISVIFWCPKITKCIDTLPAIASALETRGEGEGEGFSAG